MVRSETPTGGYFLWVKLPEGVTATSLAKHAAREEVAYLAGSRCVPGGRRGRMTRANVRPICAALFRVSRGGRAARGRETARARGEKRERGGGTAGSEGEGRLTPRRLRRKASFLAASVLEKPSPLAHSLKVLPNGRPWALFLQLSSSRPARGTSWLAGGH